jgi:hypothetical protein
MAKEEVHNWLRTAVILAAIVFAGGGYAMKVQGNSGAIAETRKDVSGVKDDVHRLELGAKDTQKLAETAVRNSAEAKEMFGKVMEHLEKKANDDTEMRIKMGKVEVKVDTLIKGE